MTEKMMDLMRKCSCGECRLDCERFAVKELIGTDGCRKNLMADALIDMEQSRWIPVSERLPENAKHPGQACPTVRVMTKWGETHGWYNPDDGGWWALLWYEGYTFDDLEINFAEGAIPRLCFENESGEFVTHWMPIPEPLKGGDAG